MNSNISDILSQSDHNDPSVADKLLPLVYHELRELAAAKIAHENGQISLQATSLVHEAYLRLIEGSPSAKWNGRGHFFAAAAEAMRRILVDRARRRLALKHGGGMARQNLAEDSIVAPQVEGNLLELDAALSKFEQTDARKANLVKLRYFVGMTQQEAANVLDISLSTAEREWTYARAWLYRQMNDNGEDSQA